MGTNVLKINLTKSKKRWCASLRLNECCRYAKTYEASWDLLEYEIYLLEGEEGMRRGGGEGRAKGVRTSSQRGYNNRPKLRTEKKGLGRGNGQ